MAIEASPDALRMLEALRGLVTRIDQDIKLALHLGESSPLVQASTAWAGGFDGHGTVIAILDSGVDKNHAFLNGKVVEEACYVRGPDGLGGVGGCPNGLDSQTGPGAGVPCTGNECFHGTHVAGIAAGNGGPPANVTFSGVARGANLMSVRVVDNTGSVAFSDVLMGLERVYALRSTHNFAAVNLSLGAPNQPFGSNCDAALPAMTTIVQNLRAAGIAAAISSGNDGFVDAISFPACVSEVISVASNDDGSAGTSANQVSDFSNVAPFVSLIAPGNGSPRPSPATCSRRSPARPWRAAGGRRPRRAQAGDPSASVTDLLDALRNTGLSTTDVVSAQRPQAQARS